MHSYLQMPSVNHMPLGLISSQHLARGCVLVAVETDASIPGSPSLSCPLWPFSMPSAKWFLSFDNRRSTELWFSEAEPETTLHHTESKHEKGEDWLHPTPTFLWLTLLSPPHPAMFRQLKKPATFVTVTFNDAANFDEDHKSVKLFLENAAHAPLTFVSNLSCVNIRHFFKAHSELLEFPISYLFQCQEFQECQNPKQFLLLVKEPC